MINIAPMNMIDNDIKVADNAMVLFMIVLLSMYNDPV